MKSTAAVLFESGQKLEIREVDVQDPGPGEVRIRMVASGVCHSDLHVMTGHLSAPLPAVLGHEGAGIVADSVPEREYDETIHKASVLYEAIRRAEALRKELEP